MHESAPSRAPSRAHLAAAGIAAALSSTLLLGACKSDTPPEPVKETTTPTTKATASASGSADGRAVMSAFPRPTPRRATVTGRPAASVTPSEDDPLKGKWTLADALKDVSGKGALLATIETDMGTLTCTLFEDKAPITVANFVGLAKGTRPWKDPDNKWVKRPAYDGTIFHRIIKGFMIQGGDAKGTGAGEPGYVIPDEVWDDAYHDRAGQLCMANRGPNTNGAQFFITDGAAPHLDNRYTIFGECGPVDLVHKIAAVEVKGEKPASPPKIKKVGIKRGPSTVASASASASASAAPAPPAEK